MLDLDNSTAIFRVCVLPLPSLLPPSSLALIIMRYDLSLRFSPIRIFRASLLATARGASSELKLCDLHSGGHNTGTCNSCKGSVLSDSENLFV